MADSEENEWATGEIECDICGENWEGVYPLRAERLECPNCGFMVANPNFKF